MLKGDVKYLFVIDNKSSAPKGGGTATLPNPRPPVAQFRRGQGDR